MRSASNRVPKQEIHADDTALLLYTGGTTGTAKGAVLTHKNIVANAIQARAWMTDVEDGKEVIMTALPLFHSYGMTACHHFAVLCKSAMVLVPKFEPLRVMKEINRVKVTIFPGVPTMYVAVNNHPNVDKYNLESVRLCISGGAALPRDVQQTFERITGARLVEGYGLSECSPVTHCNPMKGGGKSGSIGLPWPNTNAKIVDQKTGDTLRAGAIGELAVRGPQVMKCYWKNEKETEDAFKKEWLLTGDMGKMDEDGYFFVVDRKKDMIVSGGFNIYPREIEDVLCEHPKVSEVAVIGIPDDYFGESVKAFIVLQNGVDVKPDDIQQFCKGKLAKYKIPKEISFREELPKSLIGKVLRRVLVEEEQV